ncbi:hypothetical protein [Shewanella benthica]|nr:hypothetical protein [Shewanella benthica]
MLLDTKLLIRSISSQWLTYAGERDLSHCRGAQVESVLDQV